jgi:hypothetical protein
MKIIISESQIKDKITNLINTMGFLETSRMFGGINPFKRIIDSNPELKSLFGYYFYGIADVDLLTKERTRISYQFEIIDFGLDQEFLTLYINIKVDFDNLTSEETVEYKKWLHVVAEDLAFGINVEFNTREFTSLMIDEINGENAMEYYQTGGYVLNDYKIYDIYMKTQ